MNEEAVQYAFDLFVKDGYGDSIEDFKNLLKTNPEALSHSYNLFVKDGYGDNIDDFKTLIGASQQQPTQQPEQQPIVQPTVKKKDDMESSWWSGDGMSESEPSKTEPETDLFGINQKVFGVKQPQQEQVEPIKRPETVEEASGTWGNRAKKEQPFSEPLSDYMQVYGPKKGEGVLAPTKPLDFVGRMTPELVKERTPKFLEDGLNALTPKQLASYGAKGAKETFDYYFKDAGFKFETDREYVRAISPDGREYTYNTLYPSRESLDEFKNFVRESAFNNPQIADKAYLYEKENKKFKTKEDISNEVKTINSQEEQFNGDYKKFLNLKRDIDEIEADLKRWRDFGEQNTPKYIQTEAYLNERKKELQDYAGTMDSKAKVLEAQQTQLDKAVGKYTEFQATQGDFGGNIYRTITNTISGNFSQFLRLAVGKTIDVTPMSFLLGEESYQSQRDIRLKEKGYKDEKVVPISVLNEIDDEIREEFKKAAISGKVGDEKLNNILTVQGVRQAMSETLNAPITTTDEYLRERQEKGSWIERGLLGLSGSLPAMVGGPAMRYINMYLMNTDAAMQEMDNNPNFANISENEKQLVALPIGVVSAALEEIGLKNLKLGKSITSGIIKTVIGRVPAGASASAIRNTTFDVVAEMGIKGTSAYVGGLLSEAETGILQQASEYAIKDIYESKWFKNRDMFDNPEFLSSQYLYDLYDSGRTEMVGAGVMSVPYSIAAAYQKDGFQALDDATFKIFEDLAKDNDSRKFFVTSLKNKINLGEVTPTQGKQMLEAYDQSAGMIGRVPDEITDPESRKIAMDLISERKKLEGKKEKYDDALAKPIQNKIDKINEQLTQLTEDAIQKQAASQVSVQPEAGAGQEVEVGGPEAGPKITAEESKRKEDLLAALSQPENDKGTITIDGTLIDRKEAQAELDAIAQKERTPVAEQGGMEQAPAKMTTTEALTSTPTETKAGVTFVAPDGNEVALEGNEQVAAQLYDDAVAVAEEQRTPEQNDIIQKMQPIVTAAAPAVEVTPATETTPTATTPTEVTPAEQQFTEQDRARKAELEEAMRKADKRRKNITVGETTMPKAEAKAELDALKQKEQAAIDAEVQAIEKLISAPKQTNTGKIRQIVENAAKAIAKILPKTKIVIHETNEDYVNATGDTDGASGIYIPSPEGGTIHVNLSNANTRTVGHEVFHAILLRGIKTDAEAQRLAKAMIGAVAKSLKQSGANQELLNELENFLSNYDENIQNEEYLAEVFGYLADGYPQLTAPEKSIINRFIERIMQLFGLKPMTDKEVIDFMNTLSRKIAAGEEITESDIQIINKVNNGTLFENEYVKTNGTVIDTPSERKRNPGVKETVIKNSDIVDVNELQGKPLEIVYYDNFTSSPYELKNRVSGSVLNKKGEGGPAYSYRPEIKKAGIIAAFTNVTKSLNLIQGVRARNANAKEAAIIGVALQNKETGHLGNLTTSRDFYSPTEGVIAQAISDGIISEQDAVKILKDAVNAYESTKYGKDSETSLKFTANDFNTLEEFYKNINSISFERRGTFNNNVIPSKSNLRISKSTRPYVVTWINAGIPTLKDYYDATTEQYTNNAEAHDIVKYLNPNLDKVGISSSVEVSDAEIKRAKEMGVEIVKVEDNLAHTSYPVVLFGDNVGIPNFFNSVRKMAKDWDVPNPFFKAGRRSEEAEAVRIPTQEKTERLPSARQQKVNNEITTDKDAKPGFEKALNSLNETEQQREEWRKTHKVNQKQKRNPIVEQAVKDYYNEKITQEEYLDIVSKNQPIKSFKNVPKLPTLREITNSLDSSKVATGIIGLTKNLEDGEKVACRLDIPAYEDFDTWVVSIHDGNKEGKSIAYGQTAVLKNVDFKTFPGPAIRIAMGTQSKSTIARMFGNWVNENPESVHERAKELMNDPAWTQVGMNPFRYSWFYDKADGMPISTADEVIQVGALVLAKNANKVSTKDIMFETKSSTGLSIRFQKNKVNKEVKQLEQQFPSVRKQITAYHGSPHKFDKFTTDKMGTGEGVQAFGWGLYFTDVKEIAEYYAEKLSKPDFNKFREKLLKDKPSNNVINDILDFSEYYDYDYNQVLEALIRNKNQEAVNYLEENKNLFNSVDKNLYEVALHQGKTPDQYTFLEWDKKPNKEQLRNLFSKLTREQYDKGFYYGLKPGAINADIYKGLSKALGGDKQASLFLLENNIDGIKFPAESLSRGATSETARGSNYVVFDENAIQITARQQKAKNNLQEIIKQARANGYSEAGIRAYFKKNGLSDIEIDTLFDEEKGAGKKISLTEDTLPGYTKLMNRINDIIARGRRKGKTDDDIMKGVIANVESRSPEYANATDQQREQIIRDIRKLFGKKEKAAPSAAKITGKPKPKKVTVNEMTALKDQLRLEARAAREAKGDLNTKRKMLTAAIKEMKKKGSITVRQAKALINRINAVNLDNPVMVERLLTYAENIFNDADYDTRVQEVRKLQEQVKKVNHVSMRDTVREFASINPERIPADKLLDYIQALDDMNTRAPFYEKMNDMFDEVMSYKSESKEFDAIKTFQALIDKLESIAINQVKSVEDYVALVRDINSFKRKAYQLLENGDITQDQYDQAIENVGKDQAAVEKKYEKELAALKEKLVQEIMGLRPEVHPDFTSEEVALINKYLELSESDLESLSPEDLYILNDLLNNIKEDVQLDYYRLSEIVSKAYTNAGGQKLAEQLNESKFNKSSDEGKKLLLEQESAFWEGLLGLGRATSGALQKFIVSPFNRAIASFENFMKDGYSEFLKLKKKYRMKDYNMHRLGVFTTYLQEYMAQFDPANKNVKDIGKRDWFGEIISNEGMRDGYKSAKPSAARLIGMGDADLKTIEKIHKSLPKDANGKVDPKAVYDSFMANDGKFFTKQEKAFFDKVMEWKQKNLTTKQKAANEMSGMPFKEIPFHMMRVRLDQGAKQISPKAEGGAGKVRIEAGTGKERSSQKVGPIMTNFEQLFTENLEQTARNYYLREAINDINNTLSVAKKGLKGGKVGLFNTIPGTISEALNFEFDKSQFLASNLLAARAAETLLSPLRTAIELTSTFLSYPFRAKTPKGYRELFGKQGKMKKLLEFTSSPLRLRDNINKAIDISDGRIKPLGKFEKALNYLSGLPERTMMVTSWMPTFNNEFKDITGVRFDMDKFNSSAEYRQEYGKAIKEAAAVADAQTEKIIGSTTKAGGRREIRIAPKILANVFGLEGTVKKNTTAGQILGFFTNYPYREVTEFLNGFREAAEVYKQGGKIKSISQLQKPLGVVINLAAYGFLSSVVYAMKLMLLGDDEDEEKGEAMLKELMTSKGFMDELQGNAISLGASKYAAGGKAMLQMFATIAYNSTSDKEQKARIKKILKNSVFVEPIDAEKVQGYGGKNELLGAISSYIPQVVLFAKRIEETIQTAGELNYIYKKFQDGGLKALSEDEGLAILAIDGLLKTTQAALNFRYGTSLPMYNDIKMYMKGAKKEAGVGNIKLTATENQHKKALQDYKNEKEFKENDPDGYLKAIDEGGSLYEYKKEQSKKEEEANKDEPFRGMSEEAFKKKYRDEYIEKYGPGTDYYEEQRTPEARKKRAEMRRIKAEEDRIKKRNERNKEE